MSTHAQLAYHGITINIDNGDWAKNALEPVQASARGARSVDRPGGLNQVVFNGEFTPGNQWVSRHQSLLPQGIPIPPRNVEKAKALIRRPASPPVPSTRWCRPRGPRTQRVAQVIQSMAARQGSTSRSARSNLPTSLRAGPGGEYQVFQIDWSGRIDPDGNSYIFMHSKAPQNDGGYCQPGRRQADGRCPPDLRPGSAQGDLREADRDRCSTTSRSSISITANFCSRIPPNLTASSRCRTAWCA